MPAKGVMEVLEDVERASPVTGHVVSYADFPKGFRPTVDDVPRWEVLIEDGSVLAHFAPPVAPSVVGLRPHKEALLLSLASLEDWGDAKNRLHTLYYGPTGTAKTQLAAAVLRLGGGWSSVRSSAVGLTASGSGTEVEYGLLPMHNHGAVGIDELDKLSRADQAGCLSAMEEGLVPIHVGKHHEILEAEVVVIATANEPDRLTPELLDRFDFVLPTPEATVEAARQIVAARIQGWGLSRSSTMEELGRFLAWVRGFEPAFGREAREAAVVAAQHLARELSTYGRVRVRRLETLVRTALAHARLHRRDVALEDVQEAARLVVRLDERP